MAAADAWRNSATELWVTQIGSVERLEKGSDFNEKFAGVDLAADRTKIIGSNTTGAVVDAMMAHFVNQIMTLTVQDPRPPEAQWEAAAHAGYNQHLVAFRQAARADVTINRSPPVQSLTQIGGEVWRYLSRP